MFETDPTIQDASRSKRVQEITPLNDKYLSQKLFADEAVVADPGLSYAPSATGHAINSYKDATLHLYLVGGQSGGPIDQVVTVTIWGTTGLTIGGVVQWIDISKSCLDLNTGLSGVASWVSTGMTATEYLLAFGSLNISHIRVAYDWDAAPSLGGSEGVIAIWLRDRAL